MRADLDAEALPFVLGLLAADYALPPDMKAREFLVYVAAMFGVMVG